MDKNFVELPPVSPELDSPPPRKASVSKGEKLLWIGLGLLGLIVFGAILLIPPPAQGIATNEQPSFDSPPQISQAGEIVNRQIRDWGFFWLLRDEGHLRASGRLVDTETSWFDVNSRLVPVEILLTWDDLSEPATIARLNLRLENEDVIFDQYEEMIYQPEYICSHSAVISLIPATPNLKTAIAKLKSGNAVIVEGRLVRAHTSNFEFPLMGKGYFEIASGADSPSGGKTLYLQRLVVNGMEYR